MGLFKTVYIMLNKIKIVLAEDHLIVRNGFKSLLQQEEDIQVIGEAENGNQVLKLFEGGLMADILIADINMPDMDGLTLAERLKNEFPSVKVIILSMMDHEKYIVQAFNSGVKGYILKNASSEEMLFAIRHIYMGNEYICSEIGIRMVKKASRLTEFSNHTINPDINLTARELEVLKLTAEGLTNMEMADKLFTSRRTVEGHRQSLIDKTGARNSAALIVYAFRAGLLN